MRWLRCLKGKGAALPPGRVLNVFSAGRGGRNANVRILRELDWARVQAVIDG